MRCRILHCGTSTENYQLCVENKIVGFTQRVAEEGDIVYLAVKFNNKTVCGARGVTSSLTDMKPWPDADRYKQCFTIVDVEYCKPFKLNELSKFDKYWVFRYVQGNKTIYDARVIKFLGESFESNRIEEFYYLAGQSQRIEIDQPVEHVPEVAEESLDELPQEISDELKIKIMGTFQTINFINETDKLRGLETLVNDNFFSLFPDYPSNKTILIPENRKFLSTGLQKKDTNQNIPGIRGIPDALLVCYNKDNKVPFQINLIEYECYGDQKTKAIDKSNYFNGHIIPQLMRFASTFSIVTETKIREETADDWADKIIDIVFSDAAKKTTLVSWIKELKAGTDDQLIGLQAKKHIMSVFKANVKIMLIVDELSAEQKDTLTNVINAFKLENLQPIRFLGYVVRIEQRINLIDNTAEYALSIQ